MFKLLNIIDNKKLFFGKNKLKQKEDVMEEYKFYNDEGQGIMLMNYQNGDYIRMGFLQWRNHHPERAKKIISIAVDGHNEIFILIYKTE